MEAFHDPVDRRFDASRWLLERKGFLPVPIIVTEPGGGLRRGRSAPLLPSQRAGRDRPGSPPHAAGHLGPWPRSGRERQQVRRARHTSASAPTAAALPRRRGACVVEPRVLWRPGIEGGARDDGLAFNIDGRSPSADVRRRIGESRLVGGDALRGHEDDEPLRTRAKRASIPPARPRGASSGAGVVVEYDGRDKHLHAEPRHAHAGAGAALFRTRSAATREFDQARGIFPGVLARPLATSWSACAPISQGVNGGRALLRAARHRAARHPVMRYQGSAHRRRGSGRPLQPRRALVRGRVRRAGRAAAHAGGTRLRAHAHHVRRRRPLSAGARARPARRDRRRARPGGKTAVYLIVGSAWR
jgi:hypothetical protein